MSANDACADADLVPASDNLPRVGAGIVCMANEERIVRGEEPLKSAAELRAAAQDMAELMVSESFFAHVTPDGRNLADRIRATGFLPGHPHWTVGENLAWGSGSGASPRAIVRAWMRSPSHRKNILARDFEEVGIGLTMGSPSRERSSGTTFTLDFGTRDARPALTVPARLTGDADRAVRKGISYSASCSKPCTLQARLMGRRTGSKDPVVLATGRDRLAEGGSATVTVDLRANVAAAPERLAGRTLRLVTEALGTEVARSTWVVMR